MITYSQARTHLSVAEVDFNSACVSAGGRTTDCVTTNQTEPLFALHNQTPDFERLLV